MNDIIEALKELKKRIKDQYVQMPGEPQPSIEEMCGWMNGYAACHKKTLEIIEEAIEDEENVRSMFGG